MARLTSYATGAYTIEITARISTGFEKVVYTGTLTA
jgi:hypothetical protein